MDFYRIGRNHYYWERDNDILHVNVTLNIVNILSADFLEWNHLNCPEEELILIDRDEFSAALDVVAFNMNIQVTVRI